MEQKTEVHALPGRQDLHILREFDLPVALLYKAFESAELFAKWMGTSVEILELKRHGAFRFITTDPMGNEHGFHGVVHDCIPMQKITRTFEMEQTPFEAWLEFLDFEALGENRSKLNMHVVYRSEEMRDNLLKMPFAYGINMAHNRLQEFAKNV